MRNTRKGGPQECRNSWRTKRVRTKRVRTGEGYQEGRKRATGIKGVYGSGESSG